MKTIFAIALLILSLAFLIDVANDSPTLMENIQKIITENSGSIDNTLNEFWEATK